MVSLDTGGKEISAPEELVCQATARQQYLDWLLRRERESNCGVADTCFEDLPAQINNQKVIWEFARVKKRAEALSAENDLMRKQIRKMLGVAAELECKVRTCSFRVLAN